MRVETLFPLLTTGVLLAVWLGSFSELEAWMHLMFAAGTLASAFTLLEVIFK